MLAAAGLGLAAPALAEPGRFPDRTIRLVVPFPPGGGVDVFARPLAPALSAELGVPVVVENIGGAASRIGSLAVGRAAPDGHVLLLTNDTLCAAEALPPPGGTSLLAALAPATLSIASCNLLVTHPRSGIADIQAYAARMRAKPGGVNVGVPGWGTAHHLTSAALNHQLGTSVEHVPYRGGGPLIADLLAGTVDVAVVTLAAATEHMADGRLVGLAVTSRTRAAAAPTVPTLHESIAPGFEHLTWQGLLAPAGTPAPILARLHDAASAALRSAAVQERLPALGFDPVAQPAPRFATLLAETTARFQSTVAATGIRPADA